MTSRQTPTTDRQSHNQKRETARQYKSRELAVEILHWMDDPWPPASNDFRNAEVSFLRERVCGLSRQLPRGGGVVLDIIVCFGMDRLHQGLVQRVILFSKLLRFRTKATMVWILSITF